jgi:hypothetical protein
MREAARSAPVIGYVQGADAGLLAIDARHAGLTGSGSFTRR